MNELSNSCWLDSAEKIFPVVFGGRLELVFTHPTPLEDCCFRDLKITIFPTPEESIIYEFDPNSPVHDYCGNTYRIPLRPTGNPYVNTTRLRATRAKGTMLLWTTNLKYIRLRMGDKSVMLVRQPNGLFIPTKRAA